MLNYQMFECTEESSQYIVLLHGFGGNHRVWKNQIPLLQKKYNVLAINLPSHGDNELKLSHMEHSIDNITKEIIKVIDYFGIQKAVFMGVSLGTIFIRYMEMFYGSYVEKAILVGALGTVGRPLKTAVYVFSKIGDKLPFTVVYRIMAKLFMPWKVSKKSRQIFCKCAKTLNSKEFKAYMYIFIEHFSFVEEFTREIHEENVYISGSGDLCFIKGIEEEAKDTQAELIIIEHCGHVCNIDQEKQFNKILNELLEITEL
ncbi:MAG: alpha/beta fold hydrolase [Coprococcus sp.]